MVRNQGAERFAYVSLYGCIVVLIDGYRGCRMWTIDVDETVIHFGLTDQLLDLRRDVDHFNSFFRVHLHLFDHPRIISKWFGLSTDIPGTLFQVGFRKMTYCVSPPRISGELKAQLNEILNSKHEIRNNF